MDKHEIVHIRPIAVDTLRENVVLLSRRCRALRPERLKGFRKVQLQADGAELTASILIVDDPALLREDEVVLTDPAFRRLGLPAGSPVRIALAPPAPSLEVIQAKIRGETLSPVEISAVIRDLAAHRLSDIEIAAFLIACASFMTAEEVLALTNAMVEAGERLDWPVPMVVDKHCIGGIPGNRTTMIVTPIVAAHGLIMPKTSSRAITSPAGTADTMEVLACVDLDETTIRRVVETAHACIAWGGHMKLSPVDDILISVERPLALDTPEQMVASILSKKIAAGTTHLILDLPVGPTAKIRSSAYAQRVRKLFEFVADRCGLSIDVVITDGSQPIGRGVGPFLEARDVMAVLRCEKDAPVDLREKSLMLAARILEFDPGLRGGKGLVRARELLDSGAALRAMETIIAAQGPPPVQAVLGSLAKDICADCAGVITAIDCFRIARIARLAGAPTDPGAGLDLFRRIGDPVQKGETLYRIHAEDGAEFATACAAALKDSGFKVGAR
ncbi:MAG: thymidine phosphorylase family protein [Hyphomicrobiales bacterium]|nr:thymidine phosphorylase family protein [Hyphomicrobiales bacterium]